MPIKKIIDGNTAVCEAMRQINPDVVGAFPITPTTKIMEKFSEFVAQKKVETELVLAESEHASMSICVGAAAGGGRAMTATASQGLELMHEVLFNASGMRLPIVLINGNRALGAPLSIHPSHCDIMAIRDTGWIQLHAKNAQEAYDLTLQAFRIAENLKVRTPVVIAMDGFQITHTEQKVQIEDDKIVKKFLGKVITQDPLLDVNNPVSYGAAVKPDFFMEFKRSQLQGLLNSEKVILEIGREFKTIFKRDYTQHGETFALEDAEMAIVCLGSIFGTVCAGITELRKKGIKIGALRLRSFRPFPDKFIQKKLTKIKNIAILERVSPSGATGGPLFIEIRSALFEQKNNIIPFTTSLGGREFFPQHVKEIFKILEKKQKINFKETFWINLRK